MTIRTFLDDAASCMPDRPAQVFFQKNEWVTRSFGALKERVVHAATIVKQLNIRPGEHNVALMMENGPEWQEIYLALAGSGVAVVPLDPKLRPQEVFHILKDSEAVAVFAGAKLGQIFEPIIANLPNLHAFVWVGETVETTCALKNKINVTYDAMLAKADSMADAAREWFDTHRPTSDSIASIIYTSGTTGKPKGAMLTHGNFTANVIQTMKCVSGFSKEDNFLNVLPLFHSFSFTANFLVPLHLRSCCSFVRSLKTIADDMKIVKPTVLFAVPLMAEKLYGRVAEKLQKSLVARSLINMGLRTIISKKVKASFGGRLRFIGIGGAPTPVPILKGFQELGFQVLEGYGLTECAPGVAYPDHPWYVPGTVGHVIADMDYKIINVDSAGAGELIVRGPNVMKGYYKNPEATAEAIDAEGYFHTGDLVRFDAKGNMSICGRRKALIVNREGKNIYPEEVEQLIEGCPLIQDVIVLGYAVAGEVGERVGAIIVPNAEALESKRASMKWSEQQARAFLLNEIQQLCKQHLADYKIPRKIELRTEALERTSTMKVRRVVYAGSLDER